MPIKPENRHLYPPPKEWKAIRAEVLARAGNKCEFCGALNHARIWRRIDNPSQFQTISQVVLGESGLYRAGVAVVLTMAHLDQNPQNNGAVGRRPNLRALCQRCHNVLDAPFRAENAWRTRHRGAKGQTELEVLR